ncbi:uncharacterized protein B0H18DRAFT_1004613 [Fomitopsis serialis]|uniref:uncharacterized protein n=1 Tax=Fomitopsis serialis TaxID=139415 RepID=UPI002007848F|nr:uncharacterized protein B0H18DRAFT_1004613 [Neoantrodia serialis]KAH9926942.1 hypothetical protein B0H18DRAFT_1004613 [Neoantrodia serialis]
MQTRFMASRRPIGIKTRSTKPRRAPLATKSRSRARPPRKTTSTVTHEQEEPDETETEAEEPPLPPSKRRKIAGATPPKARPAVDAEGTSAPAASSTGPRRSSRQSGTQDTAQVDADSDDLPAEPVKEQSKRITRRVVTALPDPDDGRAVQQDKDVQKTLKRDRQAFEREASRREKAVQKREQGVERSAAQYQEKIAALEQRERACDKREAQCQTRENQLNKRTAELQKREQEVADRALVIKMGRTEEVLAELEAKWQCALCCDVMACPYSLNLTSCGHSYCAQCLLKWFFTNLCNACGGWCQPLDCPLCRATLPTVPIPVPRDMTSLPFTPARAASDRIIELIDSLRGPLQSSPSKAGSSKGKGKGKKKQTNSEAGPSTGWENGGTLLAEWQIRDSRGRTEMRNLIARWPQLTPDPLRDMRARICSFT